MSATVSDRCPCCGGPLTGSALAWQSAERTLIGQGHAVALSPLEAAIFNLLWSLRRIGRTVDIYEMAERVYADREDGGPDNASKSLRVTMRNLRRKLLPFGLTVSSARGRASGAYRLTEAQSAPEATP